MKKEEREWDRKIFEAMMSKNSKIEERHKCTFKNDKRGQFIRKKVAINVYVLRNIEL